MIIDKIDSVNRKIDIIPVNSPNLATSRDANGNIIPDSYDLIGNKSLRDIGQDRKTQYEITEEYRAQVDYKINREREWENFYREIKYRVPITQVIGSHVNLLTNGSNPQGLCPFHDDHKTPSLTVYGRDKEPHYHCHSCGAHGDVINFYAQIHSISNHEAAKELANKYGIPIPNFSYKNSESEAEKQARIAKQQETLRKLDLERKAREEAELRERELKQRVCEKNIDLFHKFGDIKSNSYLEKKGIPIAVANSLGFKEGDTFIHLRGNKICSLTKDNFYCVPFIDENSEIVNVQRISNAGKFFSQGPQIGSVHQLKPIEKIDTTWYQSELINIDAQVLSELVAQADEVLPKIDFVATTGNVKAIKIQKALSCLGFENIPVFDVAGDGNIDAGIATIKKILGKPNAYGLFACDNDIVIGKEANSSIDTVKSVLNHHRLTYTFPIFYSKEELDKFEEGYKVPLKDFDDLAAKDFTEFLHQLINNIAFKFYGEVEYKTLEEAEDIIFRTIRSFFNETNESCLSRAIKATPGIGKSETTWQQCAYTEEHILVSLDRNDSIDKSLNRLREINPNVKAVACHGRGYIPHGSDEPLCKRYDQIQMYYEKCKEEGDTPNTVENFCRCLQDIDGKKQMVYCPHFNDCGYINERREAHDANIVFTTHAALKHNFTSLEVEFLPFFDKIIIDEDFSNQLFVNVKFSIDGFLKPYEDEVINLNGKPFNLKDFWQEKAKILYNLIKIGDLEALSKIDLDNDIKTIKQIIASTKEAIHLSPDMPKDVVDLYLNAMKPSHLGWKKILKIISLIQEEIKTRGSGTLRRVQVFNDEISYSWVRDTTNNTRFINKKTQLAYKVFSELSENGTDFSVENITASKSFRNTDNPDYAAKAVLTTLTKYGLLEHVNGSYKVTSANLDEKLNKLRFLPILYLDQSLNRNRLRESLPQYSFEVTEVNVAQNLYVKQLTTASNSKLGFKIKGGEAAALKYAINDMLNSNKETLFVSYQDITGNENQDIYPLDCLILARREAEKPIHFGHFNSLRGSNDYKNCERVHILGRNQPNFEDIVMESAAYFWKEDIDMDTTPVKERWGIPIKNGGFAIVEQQMLKDPLANEILFSYREEETIQDMSRLRAVRSEHTKEFVHQCALALPGIEVDETFDSQSTNNRLSRAKDNRDAAASFFEDNGFIPLSANVLNEAGIFPSVKSAEKYLSTSGLYQISNEIKNIKNPPTVLNIYIPLEGFKLECFNLGGSKIGVVKYRTPKQKRASLLFLKFRSESEAFQVIARAKKWLENLLQKEVEFLDGAAAPQTAKQVENLPDNGRALLVENSTQEIGNVGHRAGNEKIAQETPSDFVDSLKNSALPDANSLLESVMYKTQWHEGNATPQAGVWRNFWERVLVFTSEYFNANGKIDTDSWLEMAICALHENSNVGHRSDGELAQGTAIPVTDIKSSQCQYRVAVRDDEGYVNQIFCID